MSIARGEITRVLAGSNELNAFEIRTVICLCGYISDTKRGTGILVMNECWAKLLKFQDCLGVFGRE